MGTFKLSHYSILVPISENGDCLITNTCHGGLMVLTAEEVNILTDKLKKNKIFNWEYNSPGDSFLDVLIAKKYLVQADMNEIDAYKEKHSRHHDYIRNKRGDLKLTVLTSGKCNMACSYCYEFAKRNSVMNEETIRHFNPFLEDVVAKSPQIKEWTHFHNTWYGGEPLLGLDAIVKLTPMFKKFSRKYGIKYTSSMITNGLLLDRDTWKILQENDVKSVQITLDGSKEVHDRNRPLNNAQGKNYERILENLTHVPEGMRVVIRINVDKVVAASVPSLMDDLEALEIWPQKQYMVNLDFAHLRTYEENDEPNLDTRIPKTEWVECLHHLRRLKVERYNRWARKSGAKQGKLYFHASDPTFSDCSAVVSPYSFVVDSEGYITKCWELATEENRIIQHISESYDLTKYEKYLAHARYNSKRSCEDCKYVPVCEDSQCIARPQKCLRNSKEFENELKIQYLYYLKNPDNVSFKPLREIRKEMIERWGV